MNRYMYLIFQVEILGEGGNLANDKKDQWPILARRDDKDKDWFTQQGSSFSSLFFLNIFYTAWT